MKVAERRFNLRLLLISILLSGCFAMAIALARGSPSSPYCDRQYHAEFYSNPSTADLIAVSVQEGQVYLQHSRNGDAIRLPVASRRQDVYVTHDLRGAVISRRLDCGQIVMTLPIGQDLADVWNEPRIDEMNRLVEEWQSCQPR